jgi:AcrR family transcriptional regulator
MPRTRSPARFAARRDALLDRAWDLLVEQGYEQTTLNGLIEHAGVSKGAFYHYFASKDEVVAGVVDRVIRGALVDVESLAGASDVSALEKLRRFVGVTGPRPAATTALRRLFVQVRHSGEGGLLDALRTHAVALCRPALERIVAQGLAEGAFETPDPPRATELLMLASDLALYEASTRLLEDIPSEDAERALLERADFTVQLFERLLGMAEGTLDRMQREDAAAVVAQVRREVHDHER